MVRRPITIRDWQFAAPKPPVALLQLVLAVLDWLFAAATLYVLLPPVGLGYLAFAGLFTAASIAGVISHVPAGLGVFEAVLLVAMPEGAHLPGVAAALIVYRLIYYLLPLLLAALAFALARGEARRGGRSGTARSGTARRRAGAAQHPGHSRLHRRAPSCCCQVPRRRSRSAWRGWHRWRRSC